MKKQFAFLALLLSTTFAIQAQNLEWKKGMGDHSIAQNYFEENKGQVRSAAGDPAPFVRYKLSQGNTHIFLLENGIAYQFNRMHYPDGYCEPGDNSLQEEQQYQADALREQIRLETYRMDMVLEGASTNPLITAEGRSSDYINYYTHDVMDVHTYTKITYHDVWPNIDWVLYTTEKGIKYDFELEPGADPTHIQLRFKDHEDLYVDSKGNLVHTNCMGKFTEERPVSFQDGKRISTRFVINGEILRFELGDYDQSKTLTIDPNRVWGTYYGGSASDRGWDTAIDSGGNVYLCGDTRSVANIANNGYQNTYSGIETDAFIVKFNSSGMRLWATYYGGVESDYAFNCAVDNNNNIYLCGRTHSSSSTLSSNGHQSVYGGGDSDAFLAKFDTNGFRIWATYYGGSGAEGGAGCAPDADGNVYMSGWSNSTNANSIITSNNSHQQSHGGNYDGFLVKFTSNGTRLWATYYGGSAWENALDCVVGSDAYVYLVGSTRSLTSIATTGVHQSTYGGGNSDGGDAFLVKFDADGNRVWGTYYGGSGVDKGESCSVDTNGNVFFLGNTESTTAIATTGAHQSAYGGETDAFLVKFNASGTRQWGTYYGGTAFEDSHDCLMDSHGNVYLSGCTSTNNALFVAGGGYQNIYGGGVDDAFLVKFNANGTRIWGTYYGANQGENGKGLAMDASEHIYMAGWTGSTNNISQNWYQTIYGGGTFDAFLVKFETGNPVGMDESERIALQLYPNPTNGSLTLRLPADRSATGLKITDTTGRIIYINSLINATGSQIIDMSGYENGIYFVQVSFENGVQTVERVVKQ